MHFVGPRPERPEFVEWLSKEIPYYGIRHVVRPGITGWAQVQYKYGLVDYLIVIDAERTLLANQLLLAQTVNLQMGASIHLIKALGGGWENRP